MGSYTSGTPAAGTDGTKFTGAREVYTIQNCHPGYYQIQFVTKPLLPHHPAPAHRLPVAVVRLLAAAHAPLVVVVPLGQQGRVAPCTAVEGRRQEGGAPLAALLPLPFPLSAAALLLGPLGLGLLGSSDLCIIKCHNVVNHALYWAAHPLVGRVFECVYF